MATPIPCRPVQTPPCLPQPVRRVSHRIPLSIDPHDRSARCSTARVLDAQLGELSTLNRRVLKITRRCRRRVRHCQAGQRAVTVLYAPILVRLVNDIQHLTEDFGTVLNIHRQLLRQAHRSQAVLTPDHDRTGASLKAQPKIRREGR
jgi:hypothetical protein